MGTFRTKVGIESLSSRGTVVDLRDVLVDTGADATWIPRHILERLGIQEEATAHYQMADGRVLTRQVGYARVHVAGKATADDVVFAEPDDLVILGARALEGLNLRVDPRAKQLISAGPKTVAAA